MFDVLTPDGSYRVYVSSGLLAHVGALTAELNLGSTVLSTRCALVTNPHVGELYAARVLESLAASGFNSRVIEIADGEVYKTAETVIRIYDGLVDAQLDRQSVVFALGGGVVGDMAGFAAATFLRGVFFVQLPTTLLAMVDASIGGKVGVDHPRGKNLVGAFKQPLMVIADTDTLASLPAPEWRAGLAEVVKHAIIADPGLFEKLESLGDGIGVPGGHEARDWIIQAMRIKTDFVARDPFEKGERAKLNLGHTFGHAFEKLSNYELRHGDAVAIGLVCAARLAARRGLCRPELVARIEKLLQQLGLATHVPRGMSGESILGAMETDKKRVNGRLRFILPRALGEVMIVDDVTRQEVIRATSTE